MGTIQDEKVRYEWPKLFDHMASILPGYLKFDKFTDVTLVSDDKKSFQAHKFLLSAFSSEIKDILLKLPHSHPLIYFRGIESQELQAIVQFLYLGKVEIYQDRAEKFLKATKDLKIDQMTVAIANNAEVFMADTHSIQKKIDQKRNSQKINNYSKKIIVKKDEEEKIKSESILSKQMFSCEECGLKFADKSNRGRHIRSKHRHIKFPCSHCDYKASQKGTLKRHEESIHQGVKYACSFCEHESSDQSSLSKHQKSVHEGVRYYCDQCGYCATDSTHIT